MKFQHKVSCLVVFCFLLVALPLHAGEKEDAVAYRNRVMKGIGSNMGSRSKYQRLQPLSIARSIARKASGTRPCMARIRANS